jgi:hypothetical protein
VAAKVTTPARIFEARITRGRMRDGGGSASVGWVGVVSVSVG